MDSFDHILNWKLLAGSHEFPGPDGGTCINEAAIIAAGFPYQKVDTNKDLPQCFCPVIGQFAIMVNDICPDELRQKRMMPFVTRLAGTRGTEKHEELRRHEIVERLLAVRPELNSMTFAMTSSFKHKLNLWSPVSYIESCMTGSLYNISIENLCEVLMETYGIRMTSIGGYGWCLIWIDCLEAMLRIGPQAEPIETELVVQRAEAIKQKALELAAR